MDMIQECLSDRARKSDEHSTPAALPVWAPHNIADAVAGEWPMLMLPRDRHKHPPGIGAWVAATITLGAEPVTVHQADGYLVVSWWQDPKSIVPPYRGSWSYEHFATLNEAVNDFTDLKNGERRGFRPHHILACKSGIPIGAVPMANVARLVRETEAA